MTKKIVVVVATTIAASCVTFHSSDAQIVLAPIDDAYTGNDPNRGPSVTGDRNEDTAFLEVRHHEAPRKKIGYIKYDIGNISPSLYDTATLSGSFNPGDGFDNAGMWDIFGLNDGEENLDDVPDGSFGEANWLEDNLSYDKGLAVDVTVGVDDAGLGIDLTETTHLGTIMIAGDVPTWSSNSTDLSLGAFLSADTNDVVTFMIASANQDGNEWRIQARESLDGPGVLLTFIPEPSCVALFGIALIGLTVVRRRDG